MPETTVPVSLRDAFLEDPFFRTGWDELNSECREMRSFASKEGDNTMANVDRGWPWLPKQWMLPQLLQDFHLPEMKDSLMLGLQEEKDKIEDRGGQTSFSKNNVFLALACKFSVKTPFKRSNLTFFLLQKSIILSHVPKFCYKQGGGQN